LKKKCKKGLHFETAQLNSQGCLMFDVSKLLSQSLTRLKVFLKTIVVFKIKQIRVEMGCFKKSLQRKDLRQKCVI